MYEEESDEQNEFRNFCLPFQFCFDPDIPLSMQFILKLLFFLAIQSRNPLQW